MKKIIIILFLSFIISNCTKDKNPLSSIDNHLDDGKIVFLSDRDADGPIHVELGTECEIYIMDLDGKNQTRLTDNDFWDFSPIFSPDGSKIIFGSKVDWMISNLIIMDIDGNNLINLTEKIGGGQYPRVAPNGSKIIYQSGGIICRIDINGANKQILTEWESDIRNNLGQDFPVQYSNDGSTILFISRREGNSDIYTMEEDGSNIGRLTISGSYDGSCSFSPDDSKILFTSYRTGKGQIFTMDKDGSSQLQLTNTAEWNLDPAFSPDGSQIIFRSNRDGKSEIYIMNSDGTNQKRLTNTEYRKQNPHFLPDGSKIIFESSIDRIRNIAIMNVDGSNLKMLTENSGKNISPQFHISK